MPAVINADRNKMLKISRENPSTNYVPPPLKTTTSKQHFPVALTCDEVVPVPLEFQAHVVGAELLELDGELDVLLWFVAVDQHVGVHDGAAGVSLLSPHQVQLVELVVPARVGLGADDVQLVPNVWVDDQTPP